MIKFFRKNRLKLVSEGKASKRMKHTLIIMAYFVALLNVQAQNIFRTACNGNMVRLDSMLSEQTIEVKDNRGRSLLQWAVACKQKEVFDFLILKMKETQTKMQ